MHTSVQVDRLACVYSNVRRTDAVDVKLYQTKVQGSLDSGACMVSVLFLEFPNFKS